jgi:large subunit ribosomal protein L9
MTKKVKKMSQVILDEKGLWKVGNSENLTKVKSGYARNYLLPKQLAKLATNSTIINFELKRKKLYLEELKIIQIAQENKKTLEKIKSFSIRKRAGENKKIFGRITNKQIIELITKEANLRLVNVQILPFFIKELGSYNINILLHSTIKVTIELTVLPQ